jgi:YidC/Oxa1 family membrane protein insertase
VWQTIRDGSLGALEAALQFLHDIVEPLTGVHAWGWAIILLTLGIRILLLPLAIKQTRSMRAMQALQPQIKELQKKYKVDRDLMRKDPEQYKAKKQKLNEEMMALYQREGANPAASCLPLLAQAPIFLALFWMLRAAGEEGGDISGAPFYFFTEFGPGGLEQIVRGAGWPGWLLILLMAGTMFWSQKQMMARNAAQMADNPMAQQQKVLLYAMPVFLAFISLNFPMGILLYWVTTNVWQVAQQAIILREVQHEVEAGTLADHRGGEAARRKPDAGGSKATGSATSGTKKGKPTKPTKGDDGSGASDDAHGKPSAEGGSPGKGSRPGKGKGGAAPSGGEGSTNGKRPSDDSARPPKKRDHLPRRGRGERS